MQKFIMFTVFIITVYQLDAQTKLITVEKGDTILVGADMKIVIPNKYRKLMKTTRIVKNEEPKIINIQLPENNYYPQLPVNPYPVYPIRQDQLLEERYVAHNESELPLILATLAIIAGTGAIVLVLAERGRKYEYPNPPVNNTFHVQGGSIQFDDSEQNQLKENHFHIPPKSDPDMETVKEVVKTWQEEQNVNDKPKDVINNHQ